MAPEDHDQVDQVDDQVDQVDDGGDREPDTWVSDSAADAAAEAYERWANDRRYH